MKSINQIIERMNKLEDVIKGFSIFAPIIGVDYLQTRAETFRRMIEHYTEKEIQQRLIEEKAHLNSLIQAHSTHHTIMDQRAVIEELEWVLE